MNDSFCHGRRADESISCLKDVIVKLEGGATDGKIYDINGNPVGNFKLTNWK